MNMYPIADLHCDLLCYLQGESSRTPYDAKVKCSFPQLESGNVKKQIMAIFTDTKPTSAICGQKQTEIFLDLKQKFSSFLEFYIAIENASSICAESECLDEGLNRLAHIQKQCGHVAYISLTWNTENRFGGGAHSKIGLKPDGKRLLEFLSNRRIAVDLSHASDALAYEILETIDKYTLHIPVLASHSNFRAIRDVPRNLPDTLALEIIRREGLIGYNFIKDFVGGDENPYFAKHLEHALNLGGAKNLCFGADFYFEGDLPPAFYKPSSFITGFDHAGCYGKVIETWNKDLTLDDLLLKDVTFGNLTRFFSKNIF